ncbi:alpha/beta fold hydrolase [Pseudonocardia acaciae]|uniref:alpha/beta fold hydrolase n=1 Tax=Pseudonocardia acaciae TaxID=551276 RepID=UPI00048BA834|nr:alpha/beta fold hydrolase [Pseudonocardia acaciae]
MTTTGTKLPENVTERLVPVLGGRVQARVLVAGTGEPVLFLHGAGGLMWDPFLEALAAGHTVYAVEHPGAGESDALTHLPGIWELVLFYDELLDGLGLDAVSVVGHSFGGMVATELAANNPRRVSRLALIAPIGLWRDDAPIPDIAAVPKGELPALVLADPTGPLAEMLTPPADDPQALFEAAVRMASVLHFIWPLPDKGLRRRIHRVSAPTLLVWGELDKLVSPVYAEEFAGLLRRSETTLVPDAGHLPHLEQPEPVRRAVLGFLDRPSQELPG